MSKDFLKGSWSLARVKGAVLGSGRALVSKLYGPVYRRIPTRCDLGASRSEHVKRPLHMVDAGGEVGATLQQLHLLAEVVHGGADGGGGGDSE